MAEASIDLPAVGAILAKARKAATAYYRLTGKPLGISGEVGEFEAARLLRLKLAAARTAGYDAIDQSGFRLQIKTRLIPTERKLGGQRIGSINLKKPWHAVLLVLLDENFKPREIHTAKRAAITRALRRPGSKARNVRGQLAVSKFISIGRQISPT